jgi:hypothetical protein
MLVSSLNFVRSHSALAEIVSLAILQIRDNLILSQRPSDAIINIYLGWITASDTKGLQLYGDNLHHQWIVNMQDLLDKDEEVQMESRIHLYYILCIVIILYVHQNCPEAYRSVTKLII